MTAADPYKVKHVEPVLKSSDVLARIFTLAPGDTIPWHYHQRSHEQTYSAGLSIAAVTLVRALNRQFE